MGEDMNQGEETIWLKRQALQIVMQLPDDREDAIKVLAFAKELVVEYLKPDVLADAEVLRLVVR